MSNAIFAHGTLLQRGDGESVETFTTIAEVQDVNGIPLSMDTIEVTNQDSEGGWEEFIGGILRTGEITYDINYQPTSATHLSLISDMTGRVKRNFKLIFPDETEIPFTALVTGFSPSAPVDGALTASVTLKGTGKPGVAPEESGGLTALTGEDSAAGALTFVPGFDNEIYLYTVDVANTIAFVKLTPTAADHTIKIDGNVVVSTEQSGEIALGAAGSNTQITIVAQEAGKLAVTYTIIVTRAA